MPVIAASAKAAAGLISGISGIVQKAKARKMEKNNIRPIKETPQSIKTNQLLAEKLAKDGMPAEQYNLAKQNIARNANSALSGATTRGGGLAMIGSIQQLSDDSGARLDANNISQRVANIRGLMQQNQVMGQYEDSNWNWNKKQKFQETAAAIQALKAAGNANINTGLNGIIGAGASLAGGMGGGAETGAAGATGGFDANEFMQKIYKTRGYKGNGGII